ncbi:MAG: site-specific integrase [Planctomycetes bacterium]|nr:site-specific integrase [Planctomycetota bacterium]
MRKPKKTRILKAGVEQVWTPTKGWRYHARFRFRGQVFEGKWFVTRREAEADRAEMQERAERSTQLRKAWALSFAMDRVTARLESLNRRPATIRDRRKRFEVLKQYIDGDQPVAAIQRRDLEAFVAKRLRNHRIGDDRKPVAAVLARTVRADLVALDSVMKLAMEAGAIAANPVPAVLKNLPTDPRDPNRPTFHGGELGACIARIRESEAPAAERDATIIEFMAYTAMRLREASDLRVGDVDLERGVLVIDGKRGRREKPMTPQVRTLVAKLMLVGGRKPADRLLPLTYLGLQQVFRRWADRLAEPRLKPHAVRRTSALQMAKLGASAFKIRDHLGHKTLTQANTYVAAAKSASAEEMQLSFDAPNADSQATASSS